MTDPNVTKKLDSGFRLILILWGAIFASLGVFLGVCLGWGDTLPGAVGDAFPLETLRYALFGLSVVTLVVAHLVRRVRCLFREIGEGAAHCGVPGMHGVFGG